MMQRADLLKITIAEYWWGCEITDGYNRAGEECDFGR
jgi:hypothetical protein